MLIGKFNSKISLLLLLFTIFTKIGQIEVIIVILSIYFIVNFDIFFNQT